MSTSPDLSFIDGYKAARARLDNAGARAAKPRDILRVASEPSPVPAPVLPEITADMIREIVSKMFPGIVAKDDDIAKNELNTIPDRRIPIREIIKQVSVKRGVSCAAIISSRRNVDLCLARQEVMWRAREETILSLPQIARALGDRDHTTVRHGIRRHQARIDAGEVTGS